MKTAVQTLVNKIKRRIDYDIVDTDLDNLILDAINDTIKGMKQIFYDHQVYQAISSSNTFETTYLQAYASYIIASITGDATTFTPVAGDTINVTIDGTTTNVALAGCTTIALVVAAINTAVGSTVASTTTDGYLKLTSLVTTAASSVTIANGVGTPADRLFVSALKTRTGISDLDEILMISERTFKFSVQMIAYQDLIERYPDPLSITAKVADVCARWNDLIYFGPTPNTAQTYYMDYIRAIHDVLLTDNSPYDDIYDPVVIAMAKYEIVKWLDPSNVASITGAKSDRDEAIKTFIVDAGRNIRENRQTNSRRNTIPYFSPRKVIA